MEYNLLKAWNIRVPEPTSHQRFPVDGRRSEGFLILHPRQGPPKTAEPVWKQSCRPRCTVSPTCSNKQVVFETTTTGKIGTAWPSDVSTFRRPKLRHPGTCKRYDSMKGILEHEACKSTTQYHTLRHGKPVASATDLPSNSRDQLRLVREGASGDKAATLHLAERLMVCDTDVAMKRQPAARPPWPKEYVAKYLVVDSEPTGVSSQARGKHVTTDERQRRFDAHCEQVSPARDDVHVAAMRRGQPHVQARQAPHRVKSKQQFHSQVNAWKAQLGDISLESLAAASDDAALFKTQQMVLRSHERSGNGGILGKRMPPSNNRREVSPVTWRRTIPRQPKATAVMGIA